MSKSLLLILILTGCSSTLSVGQHTGQTELVETQVGSVIEGTDLLRYCEYVFGSPSFGGVTRKVFQPEEACPQMTLLDLGPRESPSCCFYEKMGPP